MLSCPGLREKGSKTRRGRFREEGRAMMGKRLRWAAALGAILAGQAAAERSAAETPSYYPVVAESNAAVLGRPIATSVPVAALQRPVPIAQTPVPPLLNDSASAPLAPVAFSEPAAIIRGQAPDGPYQSMYQPPTPPPPPPPPGVTTTPPYGAPQDGYIPGAPYDRPLAHPNGFFDRCKDFLGGSDGKGFNCHSDTAYESLITPVSNPFFFEDPRSVTEVRPLFLYQTAPSRTPIFAGGDSYFFGLQGRLALNDRWSIVINKLGIVSFSPRNPTDELGKSTGFAEFNIGPKFTFLHNTTSNTVAAFGLNFDLPVGDKKVLQDTGSLSLDPYFTFGWTFGQSSYGQFNLVDTTGFNFAVDNQRSDFFHTALHLDYDIARAHKWYPLIELNWFHYLQSGSVHNFNFEGIDLGNFGSNGVSSRDDLNLAAGFRYKFNEHAQVGVAAEFPIIRAQDIQEFRMTFDVIFRY